MTYHVRQSAQASLDLAEALDWMREHIPAYAIKWDAEFDRALDALAESPEQFPRALESDALGHETRYVIVGKRRMTYRVLFQIREESVVIVRVLHTSRQWLEP